MRESAGTGASIAWDPASRLPLIARPPDVLGRLERPGVVIAVAPGSPAAGVILDDLASVDLDVAALAQGYKCPDGTGYCLDVTIVNDPSCGSRLFPWRA